jgi:hypothetical protein
MLSITDLQNPERYKKIVDYINQRIDDYWESKCYKWLCGRVDRLFRLVHMEKDGTTNAYTGANQWMSKVSVPLVREMYIVLRSAMKRSWNQDPLITFEPLGSTTYANALNAQTVLDLNYKNTNFRDRYLREIYRTTAAYGTAIGYTQYEERSKTSGKETFYDPMMGYSRRDVNDISANCWNYAIPIKHYFQNPDIADHEFSDYKGHVKRYFLTDLVAEYKRNPELYLKDRLIKVINEAKAANISTSNIISRERQITERDISVDVYQYTGKIHTKGNEIDNRNYVVWIAGDHIIRFGENLNDHNIDCYSIYNLDKFEKYWAGNTPIENAVSYENIMSILMQTSIDSIMQGLERYIFYDEGAIDFAKINDRHKNNGFIGVRVKDLPMQNMVWDYQRKSNGTQDFNYIMQETKEAAQRVSIKADLARQGLKGGPQNETLGAAQMLVEQGQTQEFDLFDNMAYGFKQNAKNNMVLLQMNLPYEFNVRNFQEKKDKSLELKDVLGQFGMNVETALTKNTSGEIQRLSNVITMLINWKGSGNPAFGNIDQGLVKLAREVIRKNNLPDINPEEMFPDAMPMQQQLGGPPGLPADGGAKPMAMPQQPQTQPMMGVAA